MPHLEERHVQRHVHLLFVELASQVRLQQLVDRVTQLSIK